jgi:hypothetical protein
MPSFCRDRAALTAAAVRGACVGPARCPAPSVLRRYGPGSGADFLQGEGPTSVLRFVDVLWLRKVCTWGGRLLRVGAGGRNGAGAPGRAPSARSTACGRHVQLAPPPPATRRTPFQVCLPPEASLLPEARNVSGLQHSSPGGVRRAVAGSGSTGAIARLGPTCFNGTCYVDNVVRAWDADLVISPLSPDLDTNAAPADRRYT